MKLSSEVLSSMTADEYLQLILAREAVDTGIFSPVRGVQAVLHPVIQQWAGNFLLGVNPSGSFAKGTANKSGTDIDLFISLSETTQETLKRAALAHPLISFGTDSPAKAIDGPLSHETSHPRGWGSASRILGYYVREQKVLRLEEAVRKMTSFAAAAAGFQDRRDIEKRGTSKAR